MPAPPDPAGWQRRLAQAGRPLLVGAVALVAGLAIAVPLRGAEGFRFARPWALLLLGGALLAGWALLRLDRHRSGTFTFSRGTLLAQTRRGWLDGLAPLPQALRVVAVALIALALGRPQTSAPDRSVDVEGIDIVLALDLSNSMEESDVAPNRIEAAKQVVGGFIARRKTDRIGLVVFGREAFTECPLTLDYQALGSMLGALRLGVLDGRGTAIGNALGTALNRLRRSDAKSKVVILLTDGDSNAGNISPLQAARFAQTLGVKIFTVLVGSDAQAPGDPSPFGAPRHRYPVNPRLLEQIATMTGGTPYLATDRPALELRFHQILGELDRSAVHDVGLIQSEIFPRFLWPAFALLLLEALLSMTRFRKLP